MPLAEKSGKWLDTLVWAAVIGKASVEHSSKINDLKVILFVSLLISRNHYSIFLDSNSGGMGLSNAAGRGRVILLNGSCNCTSMMRVQLICMCVAESRQEE